MGIRTVVCGENGHELEQMNGTNGPRPFHGLRKDVKPKTFTQSEYLKAIEAHDIVFAIGRAALEDAPAAGV